MGEGVPDGSWQMVHTASTNHVGGQKATTFSRQNKLLANLFLSFFLTLLMLIISCHCFQTSNSIDEVSLYCIALPKAGVSFTFLPVDGTDILPENKKVASLDDPTRGMPSYSNKPIPI